MQYIKTRWSTGTQPQVIGASFNSVSFANNETNQAPNPIIIATHNKHPSQISIVHEVRNTSVKTMASPTDSQHSFHSVVSTFNNDNRDGKVNLAFAGSSADMNSGHSTRQITQTQHPRNQVFHQSYWSWQLPWHDWNQREKIFLLIIVILSLTVLSLTSVLSVVVQKNVHYRDILLTQLNLDI